MNKVFILGAGASKPAGAPLLKEIFIDGVFHLRMSSVSGDSLSRYPHFFGYLKERFDYDVHIQDPIGFVAYNDIDIEKILSAIDNEIFENGIEELKKVREEAVRFICLTLEQSIKYGPHKDNCYPDFVSQKINILKDDCTIITFNYEILLETALLYASLGNCFSYGIEVEKDNIRNFSGYEREYKENLLLLKLHGSSNWAICSLCNKLHLFWSQRYDDIFKENCCSCGDSLEAVLVPPTRFKEGKYLKKLWEIANLEKLWQIAREKIATADEIAIIGYSFNEYDKDAVSLIKDSIEANSKNPKLYIVDVNPDGIYQRIFSKDFLGTHYFGEIVLFEGVREYLDNKIFLKALPAS
jgi:NAD-dependent SIR2 family protein deacetylase